MSKGVSSLDTPYSYAEAIVIQHKFKYQFFYKLSIAAIIFLRPKITFNNVLKKQKTKNHLSSLL